MVYEKNIDEWLKRVEWCFSFAPIFMMDFRCFHTFYGIERKYELVKEKIVERILWTLNNQFILGKKFKINNFVSEKNWHDLYFMCVCAEKHDVADKSFLCEL